MLALAALAAFGFGYGLGWLVRRPLKGEGDVQRKQQLRRKLRERPGQQRQRYGDGAGDAGSGVVYAGDGVAPAAGQVGQVREAAP